MLRRIAAFALLVVLATPAWANGCYSGATNLSAWLAEVDSCLVSGAYVQGPQLSAIMQDEKNVFSTSGGGGGGGTPGGSSGQVQWNNGGAFGGFTLSGDATLVTSTGAITVTKTSGVAFGTLATLSAAPAGTLTGTSLASGVVSSNLTSVGTLTGGSTGAGFGLNFTLSTLTGTIPNANLANPSTTVAGQTCTLGASCAIGYANLSSGAPTATASVLGLVEPDGTTITNSSGAISVTYGTTSSTAAQGNDSRITGACPKAGCTFAGEILAAASTTTNAGLNLGSGSAPTSPANGDLWITTSGLFGRINGTTVGPYATSAGSGCTVSGGSANQVLVNGGSNNCVSNGSAVANGGALTLGTAGSVVGTVALDNATSGSITITPPTGALGSVMLTLPDATDTLVGRATTDTLTNKSIAGSEINSSVVGATYGGTGENNGANTLTLGGPIVTTGSGSTTLAFSSGSVTLTFPTSSDTVVGRATTDTLTNKSIAGSEINSSVVGATYGGTGVNNGSSTLTLGAALTTTGAGAATFALGAGSNTQTFPSASAHLAALDVVDQTLSGGANVTSYSISAGSLTVDCGKSPLQYVQNTGAFTITNPANDGSCILQIENGAGAGAVTFSGFSEGSNTGDSLDTTNGHYFQISIARIHAKSHYRITALQ